MNIAISQNIFLIQMLGKLIKKTLKLYTYINSSGNKSPTTMCDIPENSERWGESKYGKIEMLGIVPGTWFNKRVDVIISNNSFHDILYTVGIRMNEENPMVPFSLCKTHGKATSGSKYCIFDC